jgi:hypothetical protein
MYKTETKTTWLSSHTAMSFCYFDTILGTSSFNCHSTCLWILTYITILHKQHANKKLMKLVLCLIINGHMNAAYVHISIIQYITHLQEDSHSTMQ